MSDTEDEKRSNLIEFPSDDVPPEHVLKQLLKNIDNIECVIVGIKTKAKGFTTVYSDAGLIDLEFMNKINTLTVDEMIKSDFNPVD